MVALTEMTPRRSQAGKYLGKDTKERAVVMQWLTHQLSGLGPVQVSTPPSQPES